MHTSEFENFQMLARHVPSKVTLCIFYTIIPLHCYNYRCREHFCILCTLGNKLNPLSKSLLYTDY